MAPDRVDSISTAPYHPNTIPPVPFLRDSLLERERSGPSDSQHRGRRVEPDFESLEPGAVLAQRFELSDFLGSGAYGAVYKAFDQILQTHCCVKVLSPEASENEESRERFRREILLARRIAHRNCCQIFDLGIAGGLYYIVMEFVDGRDVMSLLRQLGKISLRDTMSIAYQVCSALRAAHEAKVIHRDLKPQNIMVTRSGVAKIMDFGIAKAPDLAAMTRIGMAVGTPSYMSPEQCRGLEADPRSDIYSLGVVLFYMLTGTQPFRADTIPALIYMHITEPPAVPSSINPDIPPDVDSIILKCLAKEPLKRFQSAVELRRAVAQVSHRLGVSHSGTRASSADQTGTSSRPAEEGTDGAQRFLDQVVSTLSDAAPTAKEQPAVRPTRERAPEDSDAVVEEEDEPDDEEITAALPSPGATTRPREEQTGETGELPIEPRRGSFRRAILLGVVLLGAGSIFAVTLLYALDLLNERSLKALSWLLGR